MNFLEIAKKRFSCRSFHTKEVEDEKIAEIIEAARIAPSANNAQPWFFYVVKNDKELLKKVHNSYHREWFNNAPVVIVCCANKDEAWERGSDGKNHADIDISIAVDHITLAATSLGLSTCWVCNFYMDVINDIFNLPKSIEAVALIPIGYSKTEVDINRFDKTRKTTEGIAKFL